MKVKQKNIFEDELDSMLNDILNVSKNINLKIWLETGTLLGCMRNNDYIPWEKDIDLGSWDFLLTNAKYKKFKKKMVQKKYIVEKIGNVITMRKYGFSCHADINFYKKKNNSAVLKLFFPVSKLGRLFNRLLVLFNSKNIFKTLHFHKSLLHKILYLTIYYIFKFFIPQKLKKIILNLLSRLKKKNSLDHSWIVPLKFLQKIKKKRFRNFTVLIPYRSSNYLKFRYGRDWKLPKSNWNPWVEDNTMNYDNKHE